MKKKQIILISCVIVALLLGIGAFFILNQSDKEALRSAHDISWYDEDKSEYVITTREQLLGFSDLSGQVDFAGKTIKLGSDIVLNEGKAEELKKSKPANVWTPFVNFAGTFDGQGHTISGLYSEVSGAGSGMFADTTKDCVIKDFKLVNSYFYSQSNKGSAAISSGGGGTFERIYTDAIIDCNGFYCGGIIGVMREGVSMSECWFDGQLTITGSCAGGLAAMLSDEEASMYHCLNTGSVTSTYIGPDPAVIGGLCGMVSKELAMDDCMNVGTVESTEELEQVGSLFGSISGGTVEFTSVWTIKESAEKAVGYAKTGINGLWGERTKESMLGFGGYQKTDLDFEEYWAVVEKGTPILQCFADSIPEIPELDRVIVADLSWYNTQKKEYVINTAEELLGLGQFTAQGYGNRFTDKVVKLGKDIVFNEGDAKDFAENAPLNEWVPIYNFTGTFDGQGHTISGLYGYTVDGMTSGMALFSGTREMTEIHDLSVVNSYFTTVTAHGLAAISSRGTGVFRNIYAEAILEASDQGSVGGIFGMATKDGLIIENCWSNCTIKTGGRRAGGILANGNGKSKVVIQNCLNTGTLTRTFENLEKDDVLRTQTGLFGGIVGGTGTGSKGAYKGDITIKECLNVGLVTSEREKDAIGGIIGGTTGLSEMKEPTVKVSNVYCTESSCEKAIGSKNSETVVYDCIRMDDAMLTGTEAYFYTSLDFAKYWAAVKKDTPILKSFAKEGVQTVAVSGARSDVSWYTPGKKNYTIKTTAQLYGLARLSLGGEKFEGITIKLAADLTVNTGNAAEWAKGTTKAGRNWTAIKNFGGTFDGQGHTISGLYGIATGVHEDRDGIGLFVETRETAVIQNITIKNSYFESTYANGVGAVSGRGGGAFKNIYVDSDVYLQNKLCGSVGAIVGITTKKATVENCWSAANITVAGQGAGGIIGNGNAQTVTIKHCLNTGTITRSFVGLKESLKLYDYEKYPSYYKDTSEAAAYFGGIIGRTGGGKKGDYTGTFVIEDCLSVGTMTSEREGDALGGVVGQTTGKKKDGTATVTIKYAYSNEAGGTKAIASKNAESVIVDCVRMKDIMLLGADAYYYTSLNFSAYWAAVSGKTPILKSFATPSDATVAVSGTRSDISWFDDSKEEYVIKDAADLVGVVRLALGGETFEGKTIKLGANIKVNEGNASDWVLGKNVPSRSWTPIRNFAGTFDGQGYTISGIYGIATGYHADRDGMGLFIETKETALIQKVTIANSYLESTYANGLAVVSGRGGGTFKQIHINEDVVLVNKICGSVGSVLGMATMTASVEECWSEAKITASAQRVGGIVGNGNSQTVTIKHCLNAGTLTRSFVGVAETLALYDYASYPSYYKDTSTSAGYFGGIIGGTGSGNSSDGYKGNFVIEDCLNIGKIISEREDDANGGVVGHTTGLNADGKETVTIANAYTAKSCCEKEIGSKNSKTKVTNCALVADEKLVGVNAFYNTELDFADYWSARSNVTPMLTSFLSETDETINVAGLSKSEFTLNDQKQGYIANLSQLESFRNQVNDGSLDVDSNTVITLTADIVVNEGDAKDWAAGKNVPTAWVPINGFTGTFDGAGYTISGLFVNGADGITGRGLFTKTNGATIQNLKVTNSFYKGNTSTGTGAIVGQGNGTFKNIYADVVITDTAAKGSIGGIIGIADGNVTVENCWTACDITSDKNYAGGVLGTISKTGYTISIKHCLNTGDLTYTGTGNSYFGGFVGRANTSTPTGGLLTVEDCLNVGVVSGTTKQTYMGGIIGFASKAVSGTETTTIINSYSAIHATGIDKAVGSDNRTNKTGATAVAYSALLGNAAITNASGLTYKTTDTEGYWTAREEKTPMLLEFLALSDRLDAEEASKTFVLKDNKGTISNIDQFISFRDKMNAGTLSVNSSTVIKLTDNIVVNAGWTASATAPEVIWTPIVGFSGIFDGDGHSISGVYTKSLDGITGIGLFTQTNGATIKNLKVTNSYFRGNSSKGTGALVGQGTGTFENIYTDAILYDKDTKGRMGGIIGVATGNVTITNCWNNGDIESNGQNVGGILGYTDPLGSTIAISHCLNTGDITYTGTANSMFGGIVGRASSTGSSWTGSLTIADCLNVGIVSGTNKQTYMGGILGAAGGNDANGNPTVVITGTYYALHYNQDNEVIGIDKAIGWDKRVNKTGCDEVDYTNLIGESAISNASGLDYKSTSNEDGYWVTRENDVPMLIVFTSGED